MAVDVFYFYRPKENSVENPWYFYMGLRSGDLDLMRGRTSSVKNWNDIFIYVFGFSWEFHPEESKRKKEHRAP